MTKLSQSRPGGLGTLAGASKEPGMWSRVWPLLIGLMVTVSLVTASLFIGVYDLNADGGLEMFFITRVPRTLALILSGASMAVAGLIMQLMTQNRFVEPSTTGTVEWAGLGLILTYVVVPQPSLTLRMVVAIIFALVGTLIFFAFLQKVTLKSSLVVPIVGLMLGAVVGAVSTFVALQTDMLQNLGIWFAGSFTGVTRGRYELLWIVAAMTILVYFIADRFTVAGLGEEIATSVGLNYRVVVLTGILIVAITTGVVSVVVGSLPFLGLVVPNIVSMFRGDNLRSNLPWVVMVGIIVITLTDIIGRTIIMPFEIPVSMILGVLGATVFVYLIVKRGRRG